NPGRTSRLRWATKDEIEASREIGEPMLIRLGWAWAVMVLRLGPVLQTERASERQCRRLARAPRMFPAKIVRAMRRMQKARRHSSRRPRPSSAAHPHLAAEETLKPAERHTRRKP